MVFANKSGYLQQIDSQRLCAIAQQQNLIIKLLYRPGQFIVQRGKIAYVSAPETLSNSAIEQICGAFSYGNQRSPKFDVEFPVRQLVEMGIRAISPAVNDPYTAIRCIDRLSVSLCHLLQKANQDSYFFDEFGELRLIADPVTFKKMVNAAFNPMRQYARSDVAVTLRQLEALEVIGEQTRTNKERAILRGQAEMIERGSHDGLPEENDCQEVTRQYHRTLKVLDR